MNFSLVNILDRKISGQSAVEYLVTYGWMLLVVAIVGGSVFSVVQSQSVESVSGFTGGDVTVDDFGVTSSGGLQLSMRNTGSETVEINSINVSDGEKFTEWTGNQDVSVGETGSIRLANVTRGDAANSLDVTVSYNAGGLSNLQVSGSISGSFEINESGSSTGNQGGDEGGGEGSDPADFSVSVTEDNSPVTEGEGFDVDYSVENLGDSSGSQDVVLSVGGVEEDVNSSVSLGSGGSTSGVLSWSTSSGDAGSYGYSVSTENSSDSGSVTVDELEGPTAVISTNITDNNASVGENIEFDASGSTEGDASITGYNWDFNDTDTSTGEIVTHNYSSDGNYTVELEVTDSNGKTNTDTVEIEIETATPSGVVYDFESGNEIFDGAQYFDRSMDQSLNGSYSIESSGQSNDHTYIAREFGSGLSFEVGDRLYAYRYSDEAKPVFGISLNQYERRNSQDDTVSENAIYATYSSMYDAYQLRYYDGNSDMTEIENIDNQSSHPNEWMKLQFDWIQENNLEIRIFDSNGDEVFFESIDPTSYEDTNSWSGITIGSKFYASSSIGHTDDITLEKGYH